MSTPYPKAKKSLGQHFLHDARICQKIVALLDIHPDDAVLEIGPGPGALTDILIHTPLRLLLLVEKDRHFAVARQQCSPAHAQAILADALTMDWGRITPDFPWKIVSNLPYNVASPLMWDIFSQGTGLLRAVFMVQKEVGQRLVARPGSKAYGGLSVWVQSYVVPRMEFIVGTGAFIPPPKVDSAVLSFMPLPQTQRPQYPAKLAWLVKMCFQNRRKQLGSIFRQNGVFGWEEACKRCNIDPQQRPEMLTPDRFQHLSAFFSQTILTS